MVVLYLLKFSVVGTVSVISYCGGILSLLKLTVVVHVQKLNCICGGICL